MIYFDNAATTRQKPPEVGEAVVRALSAFGNVGRGVHEASLGAGMTVYEARDKMANLLGAPSASRVAFTGNVTEALNTALLGLLKEGDHAITTAASHNSVLRPLYRLESERSVELTIVPIAPDASVDFDAFEAAFRHNTRVVAVTHASNLTGDIYDVERMAAIAHAHGALLVLDAAQTAGVVPIDMGAQGFDVVCVTGHKGLYGPQGTGAVALADGISVEPLKVGGSGVHSYDREHPRFMPEALEAGTLNGHGIAGLGAGIAFIERTGIDAIAAHEQALVDQLERGLLEIPGLRILGGHGGIGRTGIVAFNIGDIDSGLISDALETTYHISTRAGAHCAPLMHLSLGTEHQGAVRMSLSWFNTAAEVDEAIGAVKAIADEL